MDRREAIKRVALLMGGALSAPALAGVLGGCRADTAGGAWAPQTLSSDQNELVATLSERIIPETDTPGARAARVNEFIDEMLTSWYPEAERERFLSGLAEVDERAQQAYGKAFLQITPEEQVELLAELDREAFPALTELAQREDERADEAAATRRGTDAVERQQEDEVADPDLTDDTPTAPPPFFRLLKELTLLGYYTSEVGATQELHLNPMGSYEGDVPLAEIGRAWA